MPSQIGGWASDRFGSRRMMRATARALSCSMALNDHLAGQIATGKIIVETVIK